MNSCTVPLNEISIQYTEDKFLTMLHLSLECEMGFKESGYGLQEFKFAMMIALRSFSIWSMWTTRPAYVVCD